MESEMITVLLIRRLDRLSRADSGPDRDRFVLDDGFLEEGLSLSRVYHDKAPKLSGVPSVCM